MARLILFVASAGVIDVGEAVEGQLATTLEPPRGGPPMDFLVGFEVGVRAHRIDQAAAAGDELQAGMDKASQHSVLEGLMKIAHLPQLFFYIALVDFLRERAQHFCGGVTSLKRFENSFSREHTAFHRQVNALEAL